MKYFDSAAYSNVENTIKAKAANGDEDALEDLEYLKKAVLSFGEYVYKVTEEQIEARFARGVLKGSELQTVISDFDKSRTAAHEQAIVNAKMVNRIAAAYNVGSIFLGNASERREVGEFCIEFCDWVFANRYN